MSAQFGRWNFSGISASPEFLGKVRTLLAPYGTDAESCYSGKGIDLVWRAFYTTKDPPRVTQPHVLQSGVVVIYDGRLDNHEELRSGLGLPVDANAATIAGAAYERWGTDCLRRLVGDWAFSIWDPREKLLVLAKDFLGSRHLFYSIDQEKLTWSTVLDTLVLLEEQAFRLSEEYIAGWLSSFPAPHLSPYIGIHAVPPNSFVSVRRGQHTVQQYREFDCGKRIFYRNDRDYEEHFRSVFACAVRRRLQSNSPVLAELSGGMDSASIVCMADRIALRDSVAAPRVDTVSYFSNSEPHWNEQPYFEKVEGQRGRIGTHIDVSSEMFLMSGEGHLLLAPGRASSVNPQLADLIRSGGYRVVLSGVGGDEMTGGIPTPLPELQDLLVTFQPRMLIRKLNAWASIQRRPWPLLLAEAVGAFSSPTIARIPPHLRPCGWLQPQFVKRNSSAIHNNERRRTLLGPLPSFQENLVALDALRRQLASTGLPTDPPFERWYPFLDRTFLEFIFAIPREQLVRPGQRRSLMRRALADIVPGEVLNRRRKGFVGRSMLMAVSAQYPSLIKLSAEMVSGELGFVSPEAFRSAIERVRLGQEAPSVGFMRTLGIESWLRGLKAHGVLNGWLADFSHLSRMKSEEVPSIVSPGSEHLESSCGSK
jgi:asparagine synthase (glutamine-hydrolysing)